MVVAMFMELFLFHNGCKRPSQNVLCGMRSQFSEYVTMLP